MDMNTLYNTFNEDNRLNHSNASSVEYLTTMHYIQKYATPGCRVLELGAGTGAYSIPLAKLGYQVHAIEPVDRHIALLKKRQKGIDNLIVQQGNALNLEHYPDNSFDIVLCMGPYYHVPHDQQPYLIQECKRVCKPKGFLFLACILHDMVVFSEALYNPNFLLGDEYDAQTCRAKEDPFQFSDIEKVKQITAQQGFAMVTGFAADGLSEVVADKLNAFSPEQFKEWMNYHLHICEKKYMYGCSNHWVYIGQK